MFSSGDSSLTWSQLTVQNVQKERKMVNQPACQAPVVRSVYQAVLTMGRPHHRGVEWWPALPPALLLLLLSVPVLATLEVVE